MASLVESTRERSNPLSYQVLARKWRPQTFDTVVGQDAITRTLRNALASGRIAHAYLFAGPRGIGKTTTARLLARALLCTARTGPEPCGKCAVSAEGSLRDALSLLDTAIAYGDGRLEAETTAKLLGATAPVTVRAFATAVIGHDTGAALEAIDRAARDGEDLLAFARDVIELLRLTLVLKAAPNAKPADLTHSEGNELRKLGEAVSLDEILYALRALLEADALMRESPHPRVELEIATVRATRRPVPQALEDVLKRGDEAQRELRQQALATPSTAAPTAQASLLPR